MLPSTVERKAAITPKVILPRMVYTAHTLKEMTTRLLPVKLAMLRDAKTTSIAERMRRPHLSGSALNKCFAECSIVAVMVYAWLLEFVAAAARGFGHMSKNKRPLAIPDGILKKA